MTTKLIIRKLALAKLSLIEKKSFTEMSSLLSKNLADLFSDLNIIQNKMSVGAFAPIAKEPIWNLAFEDHFRDEIDKLTAYPASGKNRDLMIFKTARMNDLVMSKDFGFDILGPSLEALEVIPNVILVPGLVFTKKGERLGRGKGFYDKYLNHYQGIKIGICFSIQLEEMLPIEKHDVNLDYIVTDKNIFNCKKE